AVDWIDQYLRLGAWRIAELRVNFGVDGRLVIVQPFGRHRGCSRREEDRKRENKPSSVQHKVLPFGGGKDAQGMKAHRALLRVAGFLRQNVTQSRRVRQSPS